MGRDQTTPSFFMDQTQALTLLTLIALMVSAIVFTRRRWKKQKQRLLLPPGHMGLPFLGETLNFYKAQQNNRLFEDFVQHRRRKHGDVFKTRLMGEPTVVISGAVGNRFVFSNEFKLLVSSWPSTAVRLIGEQSIMQAQGEMHRRLRSAVLASLRGPALEALVPAMERAVEDHFEEQWRGRETVRLFSCVKRLTFSAVFGCLLGVDAGEVGGERFLELFETVLGGIFAAPVNLPGCRYWRAKRARVEIGKILVELVRRRRGEMGGQGLLLGRLMDLEWEGDGNEVVDNVVLLVFAAHDTTSFVIAMMCRLLAHHPECYARLVREHAEIQSNKKVGERLTLEDTKKMKYAWKVAQESMRLFPPIFGSFRKAIVDIEYQGFIIPKGWKVLWTTYSTHYDDQYFMKPWIFDPNRFEDPMPPFVYSPFGGGPRLCAGYELAKLNILVFMHMMIIRYEWSLLYPHEPITMDPLPIPVHGMPIKIAERHLPLSHVDNYGQNFT